MPKEKTYDDLAPQVNRVSRKLVERAAGMQAVFAQTNTPENKVSISYDPETRTGKLKHETLVPGKVMTTTVDIDKPDTSYVAQGGTEVIDLARGQTKDTEIAILSEGSDDPLSEKKMVTMNAHDHPIAASSGAAVALGDMRAELVRRSQQLGGRAQG